MRARRSRISEAGATSMRIALRSSVTRSGGSLALLLAAADHGVDAVVTFGAAAASWDRSPELQKRLRDAVKHIRAPVLMIHAQNDYSTAPGRALATDTRRLIIYPPVGSTTYEGHNFVDTHPEIWEKDVFAFLNSGRRAP